MTLNNWWNLVATINGLFELDMHVWSLGTLGNDHLGPCKNNRPSRSYSFLILEERRAESSLGIFGLGCWNLIVRLVRRIVSLLHCCMLRLIHNLFSDFNCWVNLFLEMRIGFLSLCCSVCVVWGVMGGSGFGIFEILFALPRCTGSLVLRRSLTFRMGSTYWCRAFVWLLRWFSCILSCCVSTDPICIFLIWIGRTAVFHGCVYVRLPIACVPSTFLWLWML